MIENLHMRIDVETVDYTHLRVSFQSSHAHDYTLDFPKKMSDVINCEVQACNFG